MFLRNKQAWLATLAIGSIIGVTLYYYAYCGQGVCGSSSNTAESKRNKKGARAKRMRRYKISKNVKDRMKKSKSSSSSNDGSSMGSVSENVQTAIEDPPKTLSLPVRDPKSSEVKEPKVEGEAPASAAPS